MEQTLEKLQAKRAALVQRYKWACWAFNTSTGRTATLILWQDARIKDLKAQLYALDYTIHLAEVQAQTQTQQIIKHIGFAVSRCADTITIHFPNTVQK